jgi:hypothetical protein
MEINAETKIHDLLKKHPDLVDFLITVSPKFKALKNPIMRQTVGKVATIGKAAAVGGLEPDRLAQMIAAEIARRSGSIASAPEDRPDIAQPAAADPAERQRALKQVIKDLHAGGDQEMLKRRFAELIRGVSAPEIARMEQALIDEGLPAEEIKRLCDVHVEIFKAALEEQERPVTAPGHPVHTFMQENRASEEIMSRASLVIGMLGHPARPERFERHREELGALIESLSQVNIHYTRKENQLFPLLEAHHFTGPSQVMWSIHDDIRARLKDAREAFARNDPEATVRNLKAAIQAIRDMIYKEEHILYPTSLTMLSEEEWMRVKAGEADIGYAWIAPEEGWPGEIRAAKAPEPFEGPRPLREAAGVLGLKTGGLTLEQLDLILARLPVDLTFVDANDRVAYYSEGPERIFPRSPAIIGREVRNCHPPKSLHLVNKILDAFKSGDRDTAEFWIELGGRFISIRYFAVRDAEGAYVGTLEVSQDLTRLRRLEGQNRLLDWE